MKLKPSSFTQVVTDTRKMIPGALFIAIPGENFDGHDFIESAISKGVKGVLCRNDFEIKEHAEVVFFRVDDPVQAFRTLAQEWRNEFKIPVIAIGGSEGKTTTKELLAAILKGKFEKVLKTEGSQNGYLGIAMTLVELHKKHQVAVVEIGIDEIGAMEKHVRIVNPTHGILTSIGPEHLEKLKDLQTVAREETLLLYEILKKGGTIALDLDNPWLDSLVQEKTGRILGYQMSQKKPNFAFDVIVGHYSGEELTVENFESKPLHFKLPLPGIHNAKNLLGAIALAKTLGLNSNEIRLGLENFPHPTDRSVIEILPNKMIFIRDYYNANPTSMEAGLKLLDETANKLKPPAIKWACLGDMLELGAVEEKYHREVSRMILELKIENVLLFGERMKSLLDELRKKKFKGFMKHCATHLEMAKTLKEKLHPEDVVLIKGSHGMKMEEVWNLYRA